MKVKKKSDKDFSKLEPDIQPFLIKVQGLIKHCGSFKVKHVLEKSKKYLIKLRKTVRIYHKNQQKLSFSDELLTSLRSLEFKLADIEERTALNKSSDVLFSTNGLDLTSSSEEELSQKTAKTPENDNVVPFENHENSTKNLNQSTEKELNSTSSSGFKSDFNDSKNSRENYLIENIDDDQLLYNSEKLF